MSLTQIKTPLVADSKLDFDLGAPGRPAARLPASSKFDLADFEIDRGGLRTAHNGSRPSDCVHRDWTFFPQISLGNVAEKLVALDPRSIKCA
jgi:hypothetical protein